MNIYSLLEEINIVNITFIINFDATAVVYIFYTKIKAKQNKDTMETTFVTEGNTEILSDEFSDEEDNSNADYLVIEEHIETKELDAKIATR